MGMKGFSLVELMIAVGVVAVLTAIAYPGYVDHVRASRRSDAKTTLLSVAQVLERCYTEFNAYNDPGCPLAGWMGTTDGGYYVMSTVAPPTGAVGYTLLATPIRDQANDKCGVLRYIHSIGRKQVQGDYDGDGVTPDDPDDLKRCW